MQTGKHEWRREKRKKIMQKLKIIQEYHFTHAFNRKDNKIDDMTICSNESKVEGLQNDFENLKTKMRIGSKVKDHWT